MLLAWLAWILAGGRIAIGLAPMVAAGASARMLGFPPEHDNATARLMGRLFGVRDIGLGVLVIAAMRHPHILLPPVFLLNLATDLADAAVIAIPLRQGGEMEQGARRSLSFALVGALLWFLAWWIARH
jgi:Domain of unknown function (DUF4267)